MKKFIFTIVMLMTVILMQEKSITKACAKDLETPSGLKIDSLDEEIDKFMEKKFRQTGTRCLNSHCKRWKNSLCKGIWFGRYRK